MGKTGRNRREGEVPGWAVLFVASFALAGSRAAPGAEAFSAPLSPGAAFRIAARYVDTPCLLTPNAWGSDSVLEFGSRSAEVLAVWTVRAVRPREIALEAECLEARFAIGLPGKLGSRPQAPDLGLSPTWSHFRPWRGRLEAILRPEGAVLVTDPKTIVASIERDARRVPFLGQRAPEAVPLDAVAPRLREAIERLVTEIFRDDLPVSGKQGGPPIAIGLRSAAGRSEGSFEISFSPLLAIEPGALACARASAQHVLPGRGGIRIPSGFSRLVCWGSGEVRTEWSCSLRYPERGLFPWVWNMLGEQRVLGVVFLARRLPSDADILAPFAHRGFVEGQVFSLELRAQMDLRSARAGKTHGVWIQLSGTAAARVARGGDRPRLEAIFLDGTSLRLEAAGAPLSALFSARSEEAVRDLTGLRFTADYKGEDLDVTVRAPEGSFAEPERKGESVPRRPPPPEEAAELARWIRTAALPALAGRVVGAPAGSSEGGAAAERRIVLPALVRVPLPDPTGAPAGELLVEVDPEAAAEVSGDASAAEARLRLGQPLRTRWRTFLPQAAARGKKTATLSIELRGGTAVRSADVSLEEAIPPEAAKDARRDQHRISIACSVRARQLLGPRAHPPPGDAASAASPGGRTGPASLEAPGGPGPAQPIEPPPTDPLPPPGFASAAKGRDAKLLEDFFSSLPEDEIPAALAAYAEIEGEAAGSWLAAAVHAECVLRLSPKIDEARLAWLGAQARAAGPLPPRILALRLAAHAPLSAGKRAAVLRPLLLDPDATVARFAGRSLGNLRDAASVEALIDALRALEARPDAESARTYELRLSFAQDLYRLLGGRGVSSSEGFADLWRRLEKRLPADPLRPFGSEHGTVVRDARAFGDVLSPPIAYVLDASSSMESEISTEGVPLPPERGENVAPPWISKFDWVRRELRAILERLDARTRFGCVVFNRSARAFAGGLSPASRARAEAARSFLGRVETRRGTHLHAALEKAFGFREVATVCLLSDGEPTVGPGIEEIDRDVFRWNYLRGVAIVVATFRADAASPQSLASTLARRHFGWLRILDLGGSGERSPAPGGLLERALGGD